MLVPGPDDADESSFWASEDEAQDPLNLTVERSISDLRTAFSNTSLVSSIFSDQGESHDYYISLLFLHDTLERQKTHVRACVL